MTGVYDLQSVALSLVGPIIASYIALELAGRAILVRAGHRIPWRTVKMLSNDTCGHAAGDDLLTLIP